MQETSRQPAPSEHAAPDSALAEVACPGDAASQPWELRHVKQLLRLPTQLLRDPNRRTWIQERGGLKHVYAHLRGLPLPAEDQKLLHILLERPREPVERYMDALHISRSTYFRRLQQLLAILVEYLNTWDDQLLEQQGAFNSSEAPLPAMLIARKEGFDTVSRLPAQMTSFVGRDQEASAIQRLLLRPSVRLVTLTGPGGVGKTRLALRVAHDLLPLFADGVYFVSLAAINDPALVIPTIALSIGGKEWSERSHPETLKHLLHGQKMLLVLDNFEHVMPATSDLLDLLDTTSTLKMLLTSRFPLHLYGEYEVLVPPLLLPEQGVTSLEAIVEVPAVALFADRARAADWQFALTEQNIQAVADICCRLDGLPLAIELAAAQTRWFTPQVICERLVDNLSALGQGPNDAPPRQQTLRSTIEWSYDLLEPAEQHAFARLGVFAGSFTSEEAAAIFGQAEAAAVGMILQRLASKHMLQVDEAPAQMAWGIQQSFHLLEAMRNYARERLDTCGELNILQERHAMYYLTLVEAIEPSFVGLRRAQALNRLGRSINDLRAALQWLLLQPSRDAALRLSAGLMHFWRGHGLLNEGRRWVEAALQSHADASDRAIADAYRVAGILAWLQGDNAQGVVLAERSLALGHALGDAAWIGRALNNISAIEIDSGNFARALDILTQAFPYAQRGGNRSLYAFLYYNQGKLAHYQADDAGAAELFQESIAIAREQQQFFLLAGVLTAFGYARLCQRAYRQAQALVEEALMLRRALQDPEGTIWCLEAIAVLSEVNHQLNRAARLWGAAEKLREMLGYPMPLVDQARLQRILGPIRASPPDSAWAAALAEGRGMTLAQAIEYALEPDPLKDAV